MSQVLDRSVTHAKSPRSDMNLWKSPTTARMARTRNHRMAVSNRNAAVLEPSPARTKLKPTCSGVWIVNLSFVVCTILIFYHKRIRSVMAQSIRRFIETRRARWEKLETTIQSLERGRLND